jgi:hypothetical protein
MITKRTKYAEIWAANPTIIRPPPISNKARRSDDKASAPVDGQSLLATYQLNAIGVAAARKRLIAIPTLPKK